MYLRTLESVILIENCTPSCSPESNPAGAPDDSFAARNEHGLSKDDCVTEWERPFLEVTR